MQRRAQQEQPAAVPTAADCARATLFHCLHGSVQPYAHSNHPQHEQHTQTTTTDCIGPVSIGSIPGGCQSRTNIAFLRIEKDIRVPKVGPAPCSTAMLGIAVSSARRLGTGRPARSQDPCRQLSTAPTTVSESRGSSATPGNRSRRPRSNPTAINQHHAAVRALQWGQYLKAARPW